MDKTLVYHFSGFRVSKSLAESDAQTVGHSDKCCCSIMMVLILWHCSKSREHHVSCASDLLILGMNSCKKALKRAEQPVNSHKMPVKA